MLVPRWESRYGQKTYSRRLRTTRCGHRDHGGPFSTALDVSSRPGSGDFGIEALPQ